MPIRTTAAIKSPGTPPGPRSQGLPKVVSTAFGEIEYRPAAQWRPDCSGTAAQEQSTGIPCPRRGWVLRTARSTWIRFSSNPPPRSPVPDKTQTQLNFTLPSACRLNACLVHQDTFAPSSLPLPPSPSPSVPPVAPCHSSFPLYHAVCPDTHLSIPTPVNKRANRRASESHRSGEPQHNLALTTAATTTTSTTSTTTTHHHHPFGAIPAAHLVRRVAAGLDRPLLCTCNFWT